MESESGSGTANHPQPPTDTSSSDDDLLELENTTTNKHSELPAEKKVTDDDLLGLGNTPSSPKEATTIEDDLLRLVIAPSSPKEVSAIEDDLLALEKNSEPSSPSSSSSSSSDSFDENFFLLDDNDPRKSDVETTNILPSDEDPDVSLKDSVTPPSSTPGSPRQSIQPDGASIPESISPRQSPQIQLMERLEPPDPHRIPSTVFARTKSTAPVEWSVQSNESLFSIHMGNNSFSRDQIFLMGRSQELGKTEDMFKFPNNSAVEINNPGAITTSERKGGVAEVAAETMKEVIRENAEERSKAKKPCGGETINPTPSIAHRSNGSTASTMSFAFPILTDGSKNLSTKVGSEKNLEVPQDPESQPQQPAPVNNWFSCFTCNFCRG